MLYVTESELRAVVPDQYRDAALADLSGGTTADLGLLNAVLSAASTEVDALIEGRIHLPLSLPLPAKLRTAALYIALEILFLRRGVELSAALADKVQFWREWLSKIGEGDLRLSPSEAPSHQTPAGAIATRPSLTGSHGLIGG